MSHISAIHAQWERTSDHMEFLRKQEKYEKKGPKNPTKLQKVNLYFLGS